MTSDTWKLKLLLASTLAAQLRAIIFFYFPQRWISGRSGSLKVGGGAFGFVKAYGSSKILAQSCGYVSQALEFFVGTLSIAKCIVILVVPLLLMYTCHQVHGKHFGSPRVAVARGHPNTKTTISPENITDTAEYVVKKRRRRKKKGKTEISDDREPNGGHKAREKSATQGKDEKLVVIKILKRDACRTGDVSGNADKTAAVEDIADGRTKTEHVAAKPGESSCATVSVNGVKVDEECDEFVGRNGGKALGSEDAERHESKYKKACKKEVALKSSTDKSKNRGDSWVVKELKEVKSVGEGPRKFFTNKVCLVLDQVADCEKKKPREVNSPRNPNLVSEGERKVDPARIEDSNAGNDCTPCKQIQTDTAHVADSHVTDCNVTDRQEGRAVPSESRNKGLTCCGGSASANTHNKTKGTPARRRSFDRNAEKSQRHLSNINQTRQAVPSDHILGTAPRQGKQTENDCRPNQNQRRRRSSDGTSKGDRGESESHQNYRFCANGKRIRRRSTDAASEDDHRVIERPENYRECDDEAQRRKTSSDNDATEIELSECQRDCQTGGQKTRRSSDYPTENVSRISDSFKKQQRMDNQRRRRSLDGFSENGSRGIEIPETNRECDEDQRRRKPSDSDTTGSEFLENRRNYQTENLRRQRPSNHYSENDSRVNGSFRKHQHPADHRRRRGSSDRTSESDYIQGEIPENPQHRPENRRRRKSSDCTSESDPVRGEIPENSRHRSDDRRGRRSFDRTSENELAQGEIHENFRHRPNNRRRRRSFGRTSESDHIEGENPENPRSRPDNRRRRRSYDNTTETEPRRSKSLVNRRRSESDNRDHVESECADEYYTQEKVGLSTEPSTAVYDAVMNPTADDEVFEIASTMDELHVAETIDTNGGQETSSESLQSQFKIDPAVRERLLNPKYPVIVPDRPLEHISYRDKNWRPEEIRGANKSLVGGIFGSKWRRKMEKQEREQEMKELAEEEKRKAELKKWSDNICPTFMIWGVCYRGDNCPLRHPSYRYLERPPRKKERSESCPEKQKSDPNSYAAILGKSSEPKEFFNEAVLLAESKTEVNKISFANVLVSSQSDRETSKVPVPKTSYEEAWPSLGSPVKGQGKVPSRAHACGPKAWSTQKGPWILKEQNSETSNLQTVSDAAIAQELQTDEYMQMAPEEYDDYPYYPVEDYDYNEDSYYDQEPDINDDEENQRSFIDSRHQTKVLELEEFNSRLPTSSVITEQNSTSPRESIPRQVQDSPCDICMDRPKDATLVCGHRFCYQCALQMRLDERVCAICRRCIVSVIKTYN